MEDLLHYVLFYYLYGVPRAKFLVVILARLVSHSGTDKIIYLLNDDDHYVAYMMSLHELAVKKIHVKLSL